jgi:hypothetical protein
VKQKGGMNKNDKRKFLMLIRIASALAGVVWVSSVLNGGYPLGEEGKDRDHSSVNLGLSIAINPK